MNPFTPYATYTSNDCIPVSMTAIAVRLMSAPGRVDDAVHKFAPQIDRDPRLTPDAVRAELAEYGAWEESELQDDAENWERLVWILAGDIRQEQGVDCETPFAVLTDDDRVILTADIPPDSVVLGPFGIVWQADQAANYIVPADDPRANYVCNPAYDCALAEEYADQLRDMFGA